MSTLKITTGSVTIPEEMLARMHLHDGDMLSIVETPEGLLLSPADPEVARQIAIGIEIMDQYDETYKGLAK